MRRSIFLIKQRSCVITQKERCQISSNYKVVQYGIGTSSENSRARALKIYMLAVVAEEPERLWDSKKRLPGVPATRGAFSNYYPHFKKIVPKLSKIQPIDLIAGDLSICITSNYIMVSYTGLVEVSAFVLIRICRVWMQIHPLSNA